MKRERDNIRAESRTTPLVDAKNSIEIIRLDTQNRRMTEAVGGTFPETLDLTRVSRILDLGCRMDFGGIPLSSYLG